MDEVMTIEEIESRFNSEWVLVENPVLDETGKVKSGRVLAHSRDRDALDRSLLSFRPRRYATWYAGQIADDMVVVL